MTTLARESEQGNARPSLAKTLFATCIGNALEWFDIAVYGFFASYIAQVFFPTTNSTVSLLLAFGSFGIAFLIRPLGAVVLGAYADKHGRKASLLLSINLMMWVVGVVPLGIHQASPAFSSAVFSCAPATEILKSSSPSIMPSGISA